MNPIYQLLNRPSSSNHPSSQPVNPSSQRQSTGNLIQQFLAFAKAYTGNPEEDLKQLVKSGKVSQQEYENARDKAEAILNIVRPFIKG